MKAFEFLFIAISILYISRPGICDDQQAGSPIAFIEGCEIDLNADGNPDSVLLINTSKGNKLIVVIGSDTKAYHLANVKLRPYLSCHYGKQLKETDAGPGIGKGKIYQTNGAYLKLCQPEGACAAYFWLDGKFKEIWLSD
jgi:hypothetical protein